MHTGVDAPRENSTVATFGHVQFATLRAVDAFICKQLLVMSAHKTHLSAILFFLHRNALLRQNVVRHHGRPAVGDDFDRQLDVRPESNAVRRYSLTVIECNIGR